MNHSVVDSHTDCSDDRSASISKTERDASIAMEIKNVGIGYGNSDCLVGVSMSIPKNQITAIVGPSGCGKSSFLSCLNRTGELHSGWKHSGDILLDGKSIFDRKTSLNRLRRNVGMISQRPNPFPFSIRKNIEIGLREHGFPKFEWGSIVKSCLMEVGLWEEVHDRIYSSALQLSGGQQQRLCIARAMALKPEILLLDEPCSALDPVATKVIEKLILKLKETTTIVIVTHNLAQARRVADQAAMFWYEGGVGKMVEFAATEDFFSNPQHSATKEFLTGISG